MRILQVLEATLGGTRRYMEDIFAACSDRGHDNGIVYASARADRGFLDLLERMRAAGWQTFHLDLRREVNLRNDLRHARELRAIFSRFRPDIVHAHSSKAGAVARIANVLRRKHSKLVYSPHAVAVHLGRTYLWIERILGTQVDVLATVSASEYREIQELALVPVHKLRIVTPTIRSDYFVPRRRDDARTELSYGDEPRIVTIGRLVPQKDPLGFLEIVRCVREHVPDLRAVWVGDGELRAAMDARVRELGLEESVSITGWTSDVRPYLAASDVYVSSSIYESFGYVTAEAYAMDRPVVASAVTGTTDIVTLDTEISLYAAKDYAAAGRATIQLLTNSALSREIAKRGRERVLDAFSPAATCRDLFAAYDAALA